uniref:Uncharacterized protein n=1 Tax=Glossina morsitans morsitans TaxID=37546 RepID=A0A1B0G128_GLOMM
MPVRVSSITMLPVDKPTANQLLEGATVRHRTVALNCVYGLRRHSLTYCMQRESIIFTEASAVPATTRGEGEGKHLTTVIALCFGLSKMPRGLPIKGSHICTPESHETTKRADSRNVKECIDFLCAV